MSSGTANKDGKQEQKRNRFITLLRKYPGISRQRCAEIMQLSTFNISRLSRDMLKEGVIVEGQAASEAEGARPQGRPSLPLYLNPEYAYFAGVDFEASYWRFMITDFRGRPVYQTERRIGELNNRESYSRKIREFLREEVSRAAERWHKVLALGVAAPGLLDVKKGIIREYEALPSMSGISILDIYKEVTEKPVYVLHNMSSLAVYHIWHDPDTVDNVVYHVGLRSGIGSEISDHGRIYAGENNRAGEIGYFPVPSAEEGGKSLHLDHVAGLLALSRKLPGLEDEEAFWAGGEKAVEKVMKDAGMARILSDAMRFLARALAGASAVIDPGRIIVYSPLFSSDNSLWRELCNQFYDFLDPALAEGKNLLRSECSAFVPAQGAALHAAGETFPTRVGQPYQYTRREALLNTPVPHLLLPAKK